MYRATPAISVPEYLHRIVRYSSLEKPSLLAAVYYIDLLSRRYPAFTLSSLTVHRFLITAITIASKGLCDAFCTNTHYAKVGGIGVAELNMLELEFLKKVDWKIVPEAVVLDAYYRSMVLQDPRYRQESERNDIQLHSEIAA
jgi:Cyclin